MKSYFCKNIRRGEGKRRNILFRVLLCLYTIYAVLCINLLLLFSRRWLQPCKRQVVTFRTILTPPTCKTENRNKWHNGSTASKTMCHLL